VVTIVTPVAKFPSAFLNERVSICPLLMTDSRDPYSANFETWSTICSGPIAV